MKTVIRKRIATTNVYEIRTLPKRKGSDYKYRLFVNGYSRSLYKTLDDAKKHLKVIEAWKQ
tara:strand:+ start:279 stop:461 length:183 start_codon:yes stop_codon:yes gene_type:complete